MGGVRTKEAAGEREGGRPRGRQDGGCTSKRPPMTWRRDYEAPGASRVSGQIYQPDCPRPQACSLLHLREALQAPLSCRVIHTDELQDAALEGPHPPAVRPHHGELSQL